jgi:hypothetical protein
MASDVFYIDGLDRLVSQLDKASASFKGVMSRGMDTAVKHVFDAVPPYPAEPAGSTYIRTMELGRKLHSEVEEIGGNVAGVIGDPVEYAPLVISNVEVAGVGPQAWMHEGRWWILQEIVEGEMPEVERILGEALISLLVS